MKRSLSIILTVGLALLTMGSLSAREEQLYRVRMALKAVFPDEGFALSADPMKYEALLTIPCSGDKEDLELSMPLASGELISSVKGEFQAQYEFSSAQICGVLTMQFKIRALGEGQEVATDVVGLVSSNGSVWTGETEGAMGEVTIEYEKIYESEEAKVTAEAEAALLNTPERAIWNR